MTIKEICEKYGLKQVELSHRFGVPLRTVEDWHAGRRNPPPYVPGMIVELLEAERKKVYLIYKDSIDDAAYIRGYIYGTEDEADAYTDRLNEGARYEWDEYDYMLLKQIDPKATEIE